MAANDPNIFTMAQFQRHDSKTTHLFFATNFVGFFSQNIFHNFVTLHRSEFSSVAVVVVVVVVTVVVVTVVVVVGNIVNVVVVVVVVGIVGFQSYYEPDFKRSFSAAPVDKSFLRSLNTRTAIAEKI